MAISNKSKTSVGENVEKRERSCTIGVGTALWKTVWWFLKKLKIELLYDSAMTLLGIYLKKTEILIQKDICTLMFTAALFTIAKIWMQPKCPSI